MRHILLSLATILLVSCGTKSTTATAYTADSVDVFYLVSTNIPMLRDADGQPVYRGVDSAAYEQEMNFVRANYCEGFNFVAPYYTQLTFEGLYLPAAQRDSLAALTVADVCEKFDEFVNNRPASRPFVLLGFSQGAIAVQHILRHMTDEQYSSMLAAYCLGYRLSDADGPCEHIVPATDATSPGVTVAFNSALSPDGLWSLVAGDATATINPVSWTTDTTAAPYVYQGDTLLIHIDPTTRLLVLDTHHPELYREWAMRHQNDNSGIPADCAHLCDLLLYGPTIRQNILDRLSHYQP